MIFFGVLYVFLGVIIVTNLPADNQEGLYWLGVFSIFGGLWTIVYEIYKQRKG